MKKGDVVVWGLIPTDQDAPETVQPTMGTFHHPTPRLETGLPFDSLSHFASTADVGSESEPLQGMAHLGKVVAPVSSTGQALVKAHPQGMGWAGCWPLHWQAVHRGPHRFHVVAVGSLHRQSHRNARCFGQQATLDASLSPVRGVGAGFSPHPGAIWSWRRPCSPNSSPAPSVRRSVPVPPATAPRTPQRPPIPGSAGGRWNRNRCPWHPTLSTDPPEAGAQHVEYPIGAGAVGNPGPGTAKPMGVHPLGDQGLQHLPELVGDSESARCGVGLGGRASTLGTRGLGVFLFRHCPSLDATLAWVPETALPVFTGY